MSNLIKPKSFDDSNTKLINSTYKTGFKDLNLIEKQNSFGDSVLFVSNQYEGLNKFKDIMNTGRKSDEDVLNLVFNAFNNEISQGNQEAQKMLNQIINIKLNNPDLVFKSDVEELGQGGAYFTFGDSNEFGMTGIHFDKIVIDNKQYSVVFHEIGHLLHCYNSNYDLGGITGNLIVDSNKKLANNYEIIRNLNMLENDIQKKISIKYENSSLFQFSLLDQMQIILSKKLLIQI